MDGRIRTIIYPSLPFPKVIVQTILKVGVLDID